MQYLKFSIFSPPKYISIILYRSYNVSWLWKLKCNSYIYVYIYTHLCLYISIHTYVWMWIHIYKILICDPYSVMKLENIIAKYFSKKKKERNLTHPILYSILLLIYYFPDKIAQGTKIQSCITKMFQRSAIQHCPYT